MENTTKPATLHCFSLEDEAKAVDFAKDIAARTGRAVTVRDAHGNVVATVQAPSRH